MSRVVSSRDADAIAARRLGSPATADAGWYPDGGFLRSAAPIAVITRNTRPRIWKVERQPMSATSAVAIGPKIAEPAPYPPTISPTTRPRRSGNHFDATGIGVA